MQYRRKEARRKRGAGKSEVGSRKVGTGEVGGQIRLPDLLRCDWLIFRRRRGTAALHCWIHPFVPDGGFRSLETHYFTGVAVSTADKLKCSDQEVSRQGRKGARENMEMLKN
jgi:hypothetical protein